MVRVSLVLAFVDCIWSLRGLECSSLSLLCSIHVSMQKWACIRVCMYMSDWHCVHVKAAPGSALGGALSPYLPLKFTWCLRKQKANGPQFLHLCRDPLQLPAFAHLVNEGSLPIWPLCLPHTNEKSRRQKLLYQSLNSQHLKECLACSRHLINTEVPFQLQHGMVPWNYNLMHWVDSNACSWSHCQLSPFLCPTVRHFHEHSTGM